MALFYLALRIRQSIVMVSQDAQNQDSNNWSGKATIQPFSLILNDLPHSFFRKALTESKRVGNIQGLFWFSV